MKTHIVKSEAVHTIGYDRSQSKLVIQFVSGHKYKFTGVGKDMFTQLRRTESVGTFMHDKILGKYKSKRL